MCGPRVSDAATAACCYAARCVQIGTETASMTAATAARRTPARRPPGGAAVAGQRHRIVATLRHPARHSLWLADRGVLEHPARQPAVTSMSSNVWLPYCDLGPKRWRHVCTILSNLFLPRLRGCQGCRRGRADICRKVEGLEQLTAGERRSRFRVMGSTRLHVEPGRASVWARVCGCGCVEALERPDGAD